MHVTNDDVGAVRNNVEPLGLVSTRNSIRRLCNTHKGRVLHAQIGHGATMQTLNGDEQWTPKLSLGSASLN